MKDAIRTQDLEAEGLMVLRFANNQVDYQFDAVCEEIDRIALKRVDA